MEFEPDIEDQLEEQLISLGVLHKLTRVKRRGKQRVVFFELHQLRGSLKVQVDNPSDNNLRSGMLKRMFFVQNATTGKWERPPPTSRENWKVMGWWSNAVRRNLPRRPRVLTDDEFVECYTGSKREMYQRAAERVRAVPFNPNWAKISAFVKAEKKKEGGVPRIISPRSPEYNVCVGRYLKPLECDVVEAVERIVGGPTIMKGRNARQQAQAMYEAWNEFRHPVTIDLDDTRFDEHCGAEALRFEHNFYKKVFNDREFDRIISYQLMNTCYGGQYKWKVSMRASGDMNTGMGNCFISTGKLYMALKTLNVSHFRIFNNGDDCVIFMEKHEVHKLGGLRQFMLDLGFNTVVGKVSEVFEETEFCQTRPVLTSTGWVMVRNPAKCLTKDAVVIKPTLNQQEYDYMRCAIATCGLALAGNVPILSSYYNMMLGDSKKVEVIPDGSGFQMLAKDMSNDGIITDECRLSFMRAFNIMPHEQLAMEDYLDSQPLATANWHQPGGTYTPWTIQC